MTARAERSLLDTSDADGRLPVLAAPASETGWNLAEATVHFEPVAFDGARVATSPGRSPAPVADQADPVAEQGVQASGLIYDVLDFGAKGNGVANDTKAIQAAINAAHAAGGGSVYLPAGLYIVTGNDIMNSTGALRLLSDVTIYGDGMGETTIKVADGWSGKITGIIRTPFAVQTHDVGVRDLTLDGNRANTSGKIDGFFTGVAPGNPGQAYNITVDGVEIMNCEGYGFDPHEQTVNLTVSNSVSHGNGLDGFTADYLINSTFVNCVAYDNGRHGFNVVTSTRDFTIVNSVAYGNGGAGVTVQRGSEDITWPTRVAISGGEFYDNAKGGILVQMADHVTIENASIHDNDTYGIRLYGATHTLIQNNSIFNNSDLGDAKYSEIQIQAYNDTAGSSGDYYESLYNTVRNNTIYENQAIGARNGVNEVNDGSDYTTVYGNTIQNTRGAAVVLTGSNSTVQMPPPADGIYRGSDYADAIIGTAAPETFLGIKGNDTLDGGGGNDTFDGGSGNDSLIGRDGDDLMMGGSGNDRLSGGNGVNYLDGSSGNDTLTGGQNADILNGGTGIDSIAGGGGADVVFGGDSNDTINGGDGNDTIDAGKGADIILGGAGDDSIKGSTDNDTLTGGAGNDTLTGGSEFDRFVFDVGCGQDTLTDVRHGTDLIVVASAMVGGSMSQLLSNITYSGGNAYIDFHNGGDTITLLGVTTNSLTASDFLII
ncbi:hypothetical protein ABAC402_11630 [Asticcacaulis sp. AC402]|nr:hypothetical protein ABAC402_11630 [Asticcacaulis sp. AC402]